MCSSDLSIAESIDRMIAYHYQGGSIYDTPFWKNISKVSKQKIDSDLYFKKNAKLLKDFKIEYQCFEMVLDKTYPQYQIFEQMDL